MQWGFSDEQEAYREALRGWLGDTAGSEQVRAWLGLDEDGAADPSDFERRLVDDQMTGVGVAEELGGQGGGLVELAITAEELARVAAPSAGWLATVLTVPALESRPDLVGSALAGTGAALVLAAESLPDRAPALSVVDGRITGSVPRVLAADRAGILVVPADDGGRVRLYVVEADDPGLTRTPHLLLDRSRSVADVHLNAVSGTLLEVDPAVALAQVTSLAGILVAADALGAMQRLLDLAVEYSAQRHQFGVPIGSFQAVKHAAASILVDLEAGRSGVYYAAASVAEGHPESALHAAAVKAQVTAAAGRAADASLTMHGAIGYTWEHDLHLFFKRARLDQRLFGAAEDWNERIADGLDLVPEEAK